MVDPNKVNVLRRIYINYQRMSDSFFEVRDPISIFLNKYSVSYFVSFHKGPLDNVYITISINNVLCIKV